MYGIKNQDRYQTFNHTADLGVEIFGDTPESLFENAAFALFDIITDIQSIEAKDEKYISVEGSGWADLLVNYLREVLYLWNGEEFILKTSHVENLSENFIKATVTGEPFDLLRHKIKTEIKAITYHQLSVTQTSYGWVGRVIFDV
jgi:SHS2 domain-containing protein